LVFALMSRKKKKDYRAVIREIIKNIPGQPSVKKVTVAHERARIQNIRDFPQTKLDSVINALLVYTHSVILMF